MSNFFPLQLTFSLNFLLEWLSDGVAKPLTLVAGFDISLRILLDGGPVISYYDQLVH